jgi:hypothetical protein
VSDCGRAPPDFHASAMHFAVKLARRPRLWRFLAPIEQGVGFGRRKRGDFGVNGGNSDPPPP